jgi:hypothetical protein
MNYPFRIPPTAMAPQDVFSDWTDNSGFMSRHPAGANFAGCDGSVHYLNELIDLELYHALATIDGSEAVTSTNKLSVDWPQ